MDGGIGGKIGVSAKSNRTHHRSSHLGSEGLVSGHVSMNIALPQCSSGEISSGTGARARTQVTVECDKGRTAPHLPTAGKYGPRDMWATSRKKCGAFRKWEGNISTVALGKASAKRKPIDSRLKLSVRLPKLEFCLGVASRPRSLSPALERNKCT